MDSGTICFLIDDDPDDREIFAIALEETDKKAICITADNGKEGLDKLQSDIVTIPNYIFLDLNMPLLNGKQFLREIKIIPRLSHIPVIIYTTSSNPKDIEETKLLGASHYLVKPSNIDTLSVILSRLLQNQPLPYLLHY